MRLSRTTGVGAGTILLLLGLWAGLIPFVGPYFNYGFQPDVSWHLTTNRLWLEVLPAAAVCVGAVTMILTARRSVGIAGGWLAFAGGIWLLIGPSLSMLWQRPASGVLISGIGLPIGGHDRAAVEMVGFFYGVGALIVALTAFSVARFLHRPAAVFDPLAAGEGIRGVRARPNDRDGGETPANEREPAAGSRL